MVDKIPIHWLHSQAFCEYEIYLATVKGVPDPYPDRTDLVEGRAAHTTLLDNHMKDAVPTTLTIPELAQEAKRTYACQVLRELQVTGHRLYGLIDEVEIHAHGHIYVLEDKPRSKTGTPFLSEIRQAQGYALAFHQNYPALKPVIPVIRDRNNGEWLWQGELDKDTIHSVNEALNRIFGILDGSWVPVPTKIRAKCMFCRWGQTNVCDKRQC